MHYGREVVVKYAVEHMDNRCAVLDIWLGQATDLERIRKKVNQKDMRMYGVESYTLYIEEAKGNGIKVFSVNIEKDHIPVEDGYFNVVIVNQVLEHVKEWNFIFSKVNRVLRKGAVFIIGVSNLLLWHERVRMLFGKPAHCLDLLGLHIRGITADNMKAYIEQGSFIVKEMKGSYFYGIFFSERLSDILCKLFPGLSVSLFFKVRKFDDFNFCSILYQKFLETNFYRGT